MAVNTRMGAMNKDGRRDGRGDRGSWGDGVANSSAGLSAALLGSKELESQRELNTVKSESEC